MTSPTAGTASVGQRAANDRPYGVKGTRPVAAHSVRHGTQPKPSP